MGKSMVTFQVKYLEMEKLFFSWRTQVTLNTTLKDYMALFTVNKKFCEYKGQESETQGKGRARSSEDNETYPFLLLVESFQLLLLGKQFLLQLLTAGLEPLCVLPSGQEGTHGA